MRAKLWASSGGHHHDHHQEQHQAKQCACVTGTSPVTLGDQRILMVGGVDSICMAARESLIYLQLVYEPH